MSTSLLNTGVADGDCGCCLLGMTASTVVGGSKPLIKRWTWMLPVTACTETIAVAAVKALDVAKAEGEPEATKPKIQNGKNVHKKSANEVRRNS